MTLTRRDFLHAGTAATLLAAAPRWLRRPLRGAQPQWPKEAPAISEPDTRELALRGVVAARDAGAMYAEVRLTHLFSRSLHVGRPGSVSPIIAEREEMAVGVRAFVNGYWGFAAGPYWIADEMVRLGREAVAQAKSSAAGPARAVELAPSSPTHSGHWETPVRIDPFTVPVDEVLDFLGGLAEYVEALHPVDALADCDFRRREWAYCSSEGAYLTQTLYAAAGAIDLRVANAPSGESNQTAVGWPKAACGWEYLHEGKARVLSQVPGAIDALQQDWRIPKRPVDAGRYDIVLDAAGVAELLDVTIGTATELDRAMGYEANASGTSYLNDPVGMLGTLRVTSPLVTVTGNRSEPTALATVKWDDEGIEPPDFMMVEKGVLVDFQTVRESATWLKEAYARRGLLVRSHGCAASASALFAPLTFPANLKLEPGDRDTGLDDLARSLEHGVLISNLAISMDFQALNGWSRRGTFYEVRQGRKIARLLGAQLLFRAPELWKAVTALGGASSVEWSAHFREKGEPSQRVEFSVGAVPARIANQTIIDGMRKA